jgi:hypothetical protein
MQRGAAQEDEGMGSMVSSYEYGWDHGYRQAADGHPSNVPAKIPDEIVDNGSPAEYERGYRDGHYSRIANVADSAAGG